MVEASAWAGAWPAGWVSPALPSSFSVALRRRPDGALRFPTITPG